jgi:hypothetical protein
VRSSTSPNGEPPAFQIGKTDSDQGTIGAGEIELAASAAIEATSGLSIVQHLLLGDDVGSQGIDPFVHLGEGVAYLPLGDLPVTELGLALLAERGLPAAARP